MKIFRKKAKNSARKTTWPGKKKMAAWKNSSGPETPVFYPENGALESGKESKPSRERRKYWRLFGRTSKRKESTRSGSFWWKNRPVLLSRLKRRLCRFRNGLKFWKFENKVSRVQRENFVFEILIFQNFSPWRKKLFRSPFKTFSSFNQTLDSSSQSRKAAALHLTVFLQSTFSSTQLTKSRRSGAMTCRQFEKLSESSGPAATRPSKNSSAFRPGPPIDWRLWIDWQTKKSWSRSKSSKTTPCQAFTSTEQSTTRQIKIKTRKLQN